MESERIAEKTPYQGPGFTMDGVRSTLSIVEGAVSNLESSLGSLPAVDENGNSDCGFAEDLYAKKEKAAEELTHVLAGLQIEAATIDTELKRHGRNLDQISGDIGRLQLAETREQYTAAERIEKEGEIQILLLRQEVVAMIDRAEQALHESMTQQYPGKKPEESFGAGLVLSGSSYPAGSASGSDPHCVYEPPRPPRSPGGGHRRDDELNDLLSLGPM